VTAEAEEVAVVVMAEVVMVEEEAAIPELGFFIEEGIAVVKLEVVKPEVVKPETAIETIVVKPEITTLVKPASAAEITAASAVEFTTAPACLLC